MILKPPKTRAQVMVLSAVTMLLMALMLMLSFNLTQAIHEKIGLQQHSDSMAYSMATIEARAMNYFAYANRATAAAAVSIMSLHAYYSSMTLVGDAFNAGFIAFLQIVGWEVIECVACCPTCCVQHCVHAGQAGQVANRMRQEQNRYNNALRGREQDFNRAVQMYSLLIDMIYLSESLMIEHTSEVLMGRKLDSLKTLNAPCSSQLAPQIGVLNIRNFACALEGSPIDMACVGPGAPGKSAKEARSKVIGNVANAARGEFPKDRSIPFPILFHPSTLQDLMRNIQSQGFTMPALLSGSAKVTDQTTSSACKSGDNNVQGSTICGVDEGFLTSIYIDTLPGFGDFSSEIYSNDSGGAHRPGGGHTGQHDEWHGFMQNDGMPGCFTTGECFVNFRSVADADKDWGQPTVYGYFQQDLRENSKCEKGPWELGTDGKLTVGDGQHDSAFDSPGVLDFVPREKGSAVSKAMVYFHRPDDWKMPPTTFDPYWKAKLHPFSNTEAAAVLGAAMNLNGAEMSIGGPVEGKDSL